jgi:hypothetical protein
MKNKYPLLLLFSVVVLFSILGSFTEGFDEMPIPSCKIGECDDDDYILKSQIVPPVCPACPPYIGYNKDEIKKSDTLIEKKDEKENKNKESNYTFKQTMETEEPNKLIDKPGALISGSNPLDGIFKSNTSNQTDITEYKIEIEKLKEQLKELKKFDGNCPPCPACERCPEPSFDCKKVPNYRSTSVGDYLPIPVLNDFSRFS